jgi:hypothetical protein
VAFSFGLSHQNPVHVSPLSHACHMPCPPHSPWFDLPNNTLWWVQIMKLPTVQLSPFFRYISSLLGPNILLSTLLKSRTGKLKIRDLHHELSLRCERQYPAHTRHAPWGETSPVIKEKTGERRKQKINLRNDINQTLNFCNTPEGARPKFKLPPPFFAIFNPHVCYKA